MKSKALQLFKTVIKLPQLLGITEAAEEKRNDLALNALKIKSITSPEAQEMAVAAARDIRTYVKDVKDSGKVFRKPLNDFLDQVSAFEKDHLSPLLVEQERLEKLVVNFQESEDRRVEAEEKARAKKIQDALDEQERLEREALKAQAGAKGRKGLAVAAEAQVAAETAAENSQAVITAPLPAPVRAQGVALKKVLKWEVTDLLALVKARPDLCKIEAKASAINAVCVPEMPNLPPGLKLWWEKEANTRKW